MISWKRLGCAVLAGILTSGVLAAAVQLKNNETLEPQTAVTNKTVELTENETVQTTLRLGETASLPTEWQVTVTVEQPEEQPEQGSQPDETPSETPSETPESETPSETPESETPSQTPDETPSETPETPSETPNTSNPSDEPGNNPTVPPTQTITKTVPLHWELENIVPTQPQEPEQNPDDAENPDNQENTNNAENPETPNDNTSEEQPTPPKPIVTMTENGVFRADAEGTATAVAELSEYNITLRCAITVSGYAVEAIAITPLEETFYVGDTKQMQAVITPLDAQATAQLHWYSENTDIVTINDSGMMTAVAPGTTKIAVQAENETAAVYEVTVKRRLEGIQIYMEDQPVNSLDVQAPTVRKLTVKPMPEDAELGQITWSIDDRTVANIQFSALNRNTASLTAIRQGKTTLTVTNGEVTTTCTLEVRKPDLERIELNANRLQMKSNESRKLKVKVFPEHMSERVTIRWSSSNSAAVTVDQYGNIKANIVKMNETNFATITARVTAIDGYPIKFDMEDKCTIEVKGPKSNLNLGGTGGSSGTNGTSTPILGTGSTGAANPVKLYTMPKNIPTAAFLTFDADFSSARTSAIISELKLSNARATFFLTTEDLYAADEQVREIAANGHAIGILLTPEQFNGSNAVQLLNEANEHLSVITGTPTRLVRVAGGQTGQVQAKALVPLFEAGYRVWEWDSSAREMNQTADAAYQSLSKAMDRTGTVTIRFGDNEATVSVLRQLLPYMKYCGIPAKSISASDTPVCAVIQ